LGRLGGSWKEEGSDETYNMMCVIIKSPYKIRSVSDVMVGMQGSMKKGRLTKENLIARVSCMPSEEPTTRGCNSLLTGRPYTRVWDSL
jgi:hypothetical protein